jgi:hypothetical protein
LMTNFLFQKKKKIYLYTVYKFKVSQISYSNKCLLCCIKV